jgi:MarR family protein
MSVNSVNVNLEKDHLRVVPEPPTLSVSPDLEPESEPEPQPARKKSRRVRRDQVLRLLADAGARGVTVKDARDILGLHHGSASAALSLLEDEGTIVRTLARRDRCGVYVLAEHVTAEAGVAPRRRATSSKEAVAAATMKAYEEGRAAGHGDGWMAGYDDGVAAAKVVSDDVRKAAFDAYRYRLQEILGAMDRVATPNAAAVHYGDCWKIHPGCAIRAVRKAVDNTHAKMVSTIR